YQALKWSGSVHICQMRSIGASKLRSITTASWEPSFCVIVCACPSFPVEMREVVVHPVEAVLPHRPVLLRPGRDLLQWCGVEAERSELGAVTPHDQPRPLQHVDVLRDGRKRQVERLGELVDGRLTSSETGQDRSPRRVGQHGEGLAERIVVDRQRYRSPLLSAMAN